MDLPVKAKHGLIQTVMSTPFQVEPTARYTVNELDNRVDGIESG